MKLKACTHWMILSSMVLLAACSTPKKGLFEKRSPHEKYQAALNDAGLSTTRLGVLWMAAAGNSLDKPVRVNIPYKETGYFEGESPKAAGYYFSARQGETVLVNVVTNPQKGFLFFTELWQVNGADKKLLSNGDTISPNINHEIKKDGDYLVRIQPELLQGLAYTITISTGPSLAFPINKKDNPRVISVWGDSRDANARTHEGIDIVAKKYTPVVAIANGTVTSVREGGIGGKVVFMRPDGKPYNLYYAHLDTQLVQQGQQVTIGDTLGLVGNTGNARNTIAHLHFGIYASGGAVDPLPFVNTSRPTAKPVKADTAAITRYARLKSKTSVSADPLLTNGKTLLPKDQLVKLLAATDDLYKIELPDSSTAFIKSVLVTTQPLRQKPLGETTILLDRPQANAAVKKELTKGSAVTLLGVFEDFYYVAAGEEYGWIRMM